MSTICYDELKSTLWPRASTWRGSYLALYNMLFLCEFSSLALESTLICFILLLQVLFGMQFAYDIGATFVLDVPLLEYGGDHGSYTWANDMLGISIGEHTLANITQQYNLTTHLLCPTSNAIAVEAQCNVLYRVESSSCCDYMHSTYQQRPERRVQYNCFTFECNRGLIEVFRPLMMAKYASAQQHAEHSTSTTSIYQPTEYNVAIHIRTGDIQLHKGDIQFFTNMIQSTINEYLSHMPVHIYYIGQFGLIDNTNTMTESPTADWSFLNTLHVNTSFYNPDEQTALHHFIHADMTIITGSAFPYLAMAVSDKPVYVTAIPKEGVNAYVYDPRTTISYMLDADGTLECAGRKRFETATRRDERACPAQPVKTN
jgi:hypothetical protein